MGDFNVTRFVEDQNRAGSITQAMTDFSEWIESEDIEQGLVSHFTEAFKQRRVWAPDWIDEDLGWVPSDQW
ncbi:hypothetical protein QJS10_CPA07g00752 [Acorus calamus]|uniref:Uncharacterized protein n=1 Tax=Acorus calamus TaxID=4465 RepID=A0AAV9EIC0_ACOCL|nr:hypothetical protein QJS10_CPA07g00752 [Acorus calamus]